MINFNDANTLKKLLIDTVTNSLNEWSKREKKNDKCCELKCALTGTFQEYNDTLINKATSGDSFGIENTKVFLPPLDDDPRFLPLLSFHWSFSDPAGSKNKITLELVNENSQILGLRFEANTDGGDHAFLHVQINNRECSCESNSAGDLTWLPNHHPHIRLPWNDTTFKSSASLLLLHLLLSLYGWDETPLKNVIRNIPIPLQNEIKSFKPT